MISQSEAARDHFQLKTREFAEAHDLQSKAYQRRQEELIEENNGLRSEIQRQREEAARVQKAHLEEVDILKTNHANFIAHLT